MAVVSTLSKHYVGKNLLAKIIVLRQLRAIMTPPAVQTTPEDVAEVMREREALVFTTTDIAEVLDVTTETVRKRLKTLMGEDIVREVRVGAGTAYYLAALEEYEPLSRIVGQEDDIGELFRILDEYGAGAVREVAAILEEHPELEEPDLQVLRTAARELAAGRDREAVIKTLETGDEPAGIEQRGAQSGGVLLLGGGLGTLYGFTEFITPGAVPLWAEFLTVGVVCTLLGTLLFTLSVIAYNLRLVGQDLTLPRGVIPRRRRDEPEQNV